MFKTDKLGQPSNKAISAHVTNHQHFITSSDESANYFVPQQTFEGCRKSEQATAVPSSQDIRLGSTLSQSSVNAATAVADTDVDIEKGLAQVAEEPPETEELTMNAQKQPVHPRNKTECAN